MHRSKTGAKDDSLLLDTPWCLWLNRLVQTMAEGPPEESVFNFCYGHYLTEFKAAVTVTGLAGLVPYQARHSGPSIDRSRGIRSLAEVARRGRWQSPASIRRFERHARLGQMAQSFTPRQLLSFAQAEKHLGDMLLGHRSVEAWTPP